MLCLPEILYLKYLALAKKINNEKISNNENFTRVSKTHAGG